MAKFTCGASRLFRIFPEPDPLPQPNGVTSPASSAVTRREFIRPHISVQPAIKPTAPPPTDSCATGVMRDDGREDDSRGEVNAESKDEFALEPKTESNDDENVDTIEPFPVELAHRTRFEMIVRQLYVALADDEHEIEALRTPLGEKFTQIVRIMFTRPSVKNEMLPSNWPVYLYCPKDAPLELQLRCPTFVRHLGGALTNRQLYYARKFITFSLPHRRDTWIKQGRKFPFSEEVCNNFRVLIVGPTDRSIDLLSVFACYLSSLTGACTPLLLDRLGRLDLVHPHWRDCLLGNMANAIPNMPNV